MLNTQPAEKRMDLCFIPAGILRRKRLFPKRKNGGKITKKTAKDTFHTVLALTDSSGPLKRWINTMANQRMARKID